MKTCIRCNQPKPYTSFYKQSDTRDGSQSWCISCKLKYQRGRRSKRQQKGLANHHPAHRSVANAVERGALPHISTRQCAGCNKNAEHYHHENYEHQLVVVPLCQRCHKIYHRIRKIAAASPDSHD